MKLKTKGDIITIKIPMWKKIRGFLATGIWPPSKAEVLHYRSEYFAYEVKVGYSYKYKTCLIAVEMVDHETA